MKKFRSNKSISEFLKLDRMVHLSLVDLYGETYGKETLPHQVAFARIKELKTQKETIYELAITQGVCHHNFLSFCTDAILLNSAKFSVKNSIERDVTL